MTDGETMKQKYWHGGAHGLKRNTYILPPSITGAQSQKSYGNHLTDKNKIYVTTEFAAAAMFAACVKRGEIYLVEPIGKLEHDPDCTEIGVSFTCEKARIIRRFKLNHNKRDMVVSALLDEHV